MLAFKKKNPAGWGVMTFFMKTTIYDMYYTTFMTFHVLHFYCILFYTSYILYSAIQHADIPVVFEHF